MDQDPKTQLTTTDRLLTPLRSRLVSPPLDFAIKFKLKPPVEFPAGLMLASLFPHLLVHPLSALRLKLAMSSSYGPLPPPWVVLE